MFALRLDNPWKLWSNKVDQKIQNPVVAKAVKYAIPGAIPLLIYSTSAKAYEIGNWALSGLAATTTSIPQSLNYAYAEPWAAWSHVIETAVTSVGLPKATATILTYGIPSYLVTRLAVKFFLPAKKETKLEFLDPKKSLEDAISYLIKLDPKKQRAVTAQMNELGNRDVTAHARARARRNAFFIANLVPLLFVLKEAWFNHGYFETNGAFCSRQIFKDSLWGAAMGTLHASACYFGGLADVYRSKLLADLSLSKILSASSLGYLAWAGVVLLLYMGDFEPSMKVETDKLHKDMDEASKEFLKILRNILRRQKDVLFAGMEVTPEDRSEVEGYLKKLDGEALTQNDFRDVLKHVLKRQNNVKFGIEATPDERAEAKGLLDKLRMIEEHATHVGDNVSRSLLNAKKFNPGLRNVIKNLEAACNAVIALPETKAAPFKDPDKAKKSTDKCSRACERLLNISGRFAEAVMFPIDKVYELISDPIPDTVKKVAKTGFSYIF